VGRSIGGRRVKSARKAGEQVFAGANRELILVATPLISGECNVN
jgi:hypothetical protein